jgi:hypothetical protein
VSGFFTTSIKNKAVVKRSPINNMAKRVVLFNLTGEKKQTQTANHQTLFADDLLFDLIEDVKNTLNSMANKK